MPDIKQPNDKTVNIKLVAIIDAYNLRWNRNAKRHDIGNLIQIIQRHGFRDPSAYDSALQAIVAGNGRIEAVYEMWKDKYPVPDGIYTENDMWYIPVLYGIDSKNIEHAIQYAIDHNNSTMMGGDFTPFDLARMWDATYTSLLSELKNSDYELPLTITEEDLDMLIKASSKGNDNNDGTGDITPPIVHLISSINNMIKFIDENSLLDFPEETIQSRITRTYHSMRELIKTTNDILG